MVRVMKDYVAARGRWIDSNLVRDTKIPAQPTVAYTGPEKFPTNQLVFRAGEFKGSAAFAAMKWRVAVIAPPASKDGKLSAPGKYEITPTWESTELTTYTPDLSLTSDVATVGRTYRLRVSFKDITGRWSHWSQPVEFTVGQ